METHAFGRFSAPLLFLAVASCAPTTPRPLTPRTLAPLPAGIYELSAHVSYRNDTPEHTAETYDSYGARLQVTWDGTVRLYDGSKECLDLADVPADENRGRPPPPAGHYFRCGSVSWALWGNDGHIQGRATAQVTAMIMSRIECLGWSIVGGNEVCNSWGRVVNPRTIGVVGTVSAHKVSDW